MSATIQFRRGTAAAWTTANPTLAQGEGGLETDTGKLKFGDGSTAWNSLAYTGAAPGVQGGYAPLDSGLLVPQAYLPSVIGPVAVSGTPTSGQVPTATSGTTASWQTPSGGGGGGSDFSAVRLVQAAGLAAYGPFSSQLITLPNVPTHGLYLMWSISDGTTQVTSITQTGSSWSRLYRTSTNCAHELWYTPSATGVDVTVNMSASQYPGGAVMEFSGLVSNAVVGHNDYTIDNGLLVAPTGTAILLYIMSYRANQNPTRPGKIIPLATPAIAAGATGLYFSVAPRSLVPQYEYWNGGTTQATATIAGIS